MRAPIRAEDLLMMMLPAEYAAMTQRLEEVGNRFRMAETLGALARFLAMMTPVTAVALFVAGFFTLSGWMHLAIICGWLAMLVWGYWRYLHRALFHRPSYAEIARLIEENAEGRLEEPLGNSLINAVLLAQEAEESESDGRGGRRTGGGHAWTPEVLKESWARAERLPLEQSVQWRAPRNAWIAAGIVLAACAAVVGLSPATFAHGLAVLLQPTQFVPRQGSVHILSVVPGDDTALAGQVLAFSVTVDAPEHKTVPTFLDIQYASGKKVSLLMQAFGAENSQYRREGVVAAEAMEYSIRAGDSESERYRIAVLPQIHLVDYTLEAVPPVYTGRQKMQVDLKGAEATAAKGSLAAPVGSEVAISVTLDAAPKEVLLDSGAGGPVPMAGQGDGRTFTTKVTLKENVKFSLRVNDGANRTLKQFPEGDGGGQAFYQLTPMPDAPPTIAVTEPGRDVDAKPGAKVGLEAQATDDYGLMQVRLEVAKNDEKEFRTVQSWPIGKAKEGGSSKAATVQAEIELPADQYKLGDTLRYRFVATDNRDLTAIEPAWGSQSTGGQVFTISLNDTALAAARSSKLWEELRQKLNEMLAREIGQRQQANGLVPTLSVDAMRKLMTPISDGQKQLRGDMAAVAKDFPFEPSMKLVQKTLQVLTVEDATSAVDRSADILLLSDTRSLTPLATKLRQHQSRIIDVLQTLLAMVAAEQNHVASTLDHTGGDAPVDPREAWKKLADELRKFDKEQRGVIDATADLAKKPKDQFGDDDNKKLKDLAAIEDQWEKFLNNRLADMSKIAEQDQANASLLEEMVQMKVELATAKDALQNKAMEIATPLEENGLENAESLTTHIERWLQQEPDRKNWQMEEPVTQNDPKMAELPQQLQDMVGDLMDKEEDLTQEMESLASKFADSMDKGAGWDAADGPISNMSAQGVTGNQMPKDMEIQGRSGEGREGRSSGEMIGSTAEGKEGRRTPTRLSNEPFSNSQVDDKSKLPEGGSTGGGKKGQLGGEGLEGPAPAQDPNITQRLAGQQAQIRNEGERLALQMHAAQYDNFKLLESNAYLKKSEDAIKQFHYQTALYYQEKAVQSLNTAKVLAAGEVHVVTDTSPKASEKTQKQIESAMNGPMPRGYADPVKAYFEKMAGE